METLHWTPGDVVRKLRKARGIRRYETLARLAEVNPSTLNRLEGGMVDTDRRSLEKIAEALGISLPTLLLLVPVTVKSEEARAAALLIDRAPTAERRRDLLEALRTLAGEEAAARPGITR